MATLRTPIICTVIGEGGSGGALAIGVGDRLLMLQYSTYSVISPEGCASILWKSAEKAELAAEAMGITSERLLGLGLIDEIVPEPLGGCHRDREKTAENLKNTLKRNLEELRRTPLDELMDQRYQRLMAYGVFEEANA
jgi:acetyl-CoA carboxylase carboxyl transferase subunit alpha